MPRRIAIVGVGEVGAVAAHSLLRGSCYDELLLVDTNLTKRDGQVCDLSDATYCENSTTHIQGATHQEAGQCDMIVITAGSKRRRGETSIQLFWRNASIFHSIIGAMKPLRSDAVILVVSQPVDVLTTLAQELSGLPSSQVIGSGTFLDSLRLGRLLANRLKIAAASVNAYVLGEHGDHQFVAWSMARVGGLPINQAFPQDDLNYSELADQCKHEGQHITEAKGAIVFGIASIISTICFAILFNTGEIHPVSHLQPNFGCSLSLPAVLGRKGAMKTMSMSLNNEERAKLEQSAKVVQEMVSSLKDDD